jgi:hypothetical protein
LWHREAFGGLGVGSPTQETFESSPNVRRFAVTAGVLLFAVLILKLVSADAAVSGIVLVLLMALMLTCLPGRSAQG